MQIQKHSDYYGGDAIFQPEKAFMNDLLGNSSTQVTGKDGAGQFPELFTLLDWVDPTGLMVGSKVTFAYTDLRIFIFSIIN